MDTLIARLSDVVFVGYIDGGKSSNTWVDYSCTSCQREALARTPIHALSQYAQR